MMFIARNELHRTTSTDFLKRERYLLNFSKQTLAPDDELLLSTPFATGSPVLSLNAKQQSRAEGLLRKMWHEYEARESGYMACIRGLLKELVVMAVRWNTQRQHRDSPEAPRLHPIVLDIVRRINRDYVETLTLGSMAALYRIHPS